MVQKFLEWKQKQNEFANIRTSGQIAILTWLDSSTTPLSYKVTNLTVEEMNNTRETPADPS